MIREKVTSYFQDIISSADLDTYYDTLIIDHMIDFEPFLQLVEAVYYNSLLMGCDTSDIKDVYCVIGSRTANITIGNYLFFLYVIEKEMNKSKNYLYA